RQGCEEIPLAELADIDLLLPRTYNTIRRLVDEAFLRIECSARVAAEIESSTTLAAAVADRFGSTILPESAARVLADTHAVNLSRIVEPEIEAPLALCLSGHLPLSVPAQAVKAILLELVAEMRGNRRT
ncbi:nitrogen assimilation transcriptional regulator, partial [Pseudomonas syringae pv. actinidiae ICMP 18807]